jgi:hypothetical protein
VHVLGKRAVHSTQLAGVVVEARKDAARTRAPGGVDGKSRGQCQRPLFETLDSEQLVAEWLQ